MFLRVFLIVVLIPLQSCSNSLIGEKLENSFDTYDNPSISGNTSEAKEPIKIKKLKKIKTNKMEAEKENKNIKGNISKENSISTKDRFIQKSPKSKNKLIFNPQPYRIILKLSGANPSAPAESVTNALRNAGVQFEVEKIERFVEESFLKDLSVKRKEF